VDKRWHRRRSEGRIVDVAGITDPVTFLGLSAQRGDAKALVDDAGVN